MEIIAVCCENNTEQINTLCGQNGEFVNVRVNGKWAEIAQSV